MQRDLTIRNVAKSGGGGRRASEAGHAKSYSPGVKQRVSVHTAGRLPKILDWSNWSSRQVRRDRRSAVPAEVAPILDRLGSSDEYWVDCVKHFGRWFRRAAGRVFSLTEEAVRAGKLWLQPMAVAN